MRLIAWLLLAFVKQISSSENCVLDNGSRDLNWEWKLKRHLRKCAAIMPPENKTKVTVDFMLTSFSFDKEEEVFSINSWIFYYWTDERIKWDPSSYGNISSAIIQPFYLWTPLLKHHSRMEVFEDYDIFSEWCEVSNTGYVRCKPREVHKTECSSNLTNWPFDTQFCTFKYGPPLYGGHDKVDLSFSSSSDISMFDAASGPGWDIIDFQTREDRKSKTQLYLTFVVERKGTELEAVIVIPSVVLSVLTMSSIFLDFDKVRLIITFLSLGGHYFFLQEISENIPKYSAHPPIILRFITGSMTFTTAAFIVTFFLKKIERRTVSPPLWVVSVNDYVLRSKGKYIILPRLKVSSSNTDKTKRDREKRIAEWIDLTNIVNSISILIGVIVYVSLFSSSMPRKNPIDSYSM